MKALLVTHNDLDGISPIILLNLSKEKFEYKSIDIADVDRTFDELFESGDINKYNQLYVVDLTLTEHVYDLLTKEKRNVLVFDHHESHKFANKYDFVNVTVDINGVLTCGTELFYLYLLKKYPSIYDNNKIKEFVKLVREKDTYVFTSEMPKELELLQLFYGRNQFIKLFTKRLRSKKEVFNFTTFEKRYLEVIEDDRKRYIRSKALSMKKYVVKDKKFGIVFADKYKDDVGNELAIKNPDLDGILIINMAKSISYRTIKSDINLNEFASVYGGGGHQKAAGSFITTKDREAFLKYYFKDIKEIKEES